MATSYNDVSVTSSWVNLVVANAALNNVPVLVQRKDMGGFPVYVFFGGASQPTSNTAGVALINFGDAVDGTAAQIWVRSDGPSPLLYTGLKDT